LLYTDNYLNKEITMANIFTSNSTNNPAPAQDVPVGDNIDKGAWQMAEESVRGRNGGFSGVSKEAKYRQIKEAYDQLVSTNDEAAKWEGKTDGM
jgi:hypothetical protein